MKQGIKLSRRGMLASIGTTGIGIVGAQTFGADTPLETGGIVINVSDDQKICQDRILPPELTVEGLKAAAKEFADNDPLKLLAANMVRASEATPVGIDPARAGIYYAKKWAQNRDLKVGFFGGTEAQRKKVQRYAELWHPFVNVRFRFGTPGPYEIRIAFNPNDGSWSYMGTDNLVIPTNRPTMNFGWVVDNSGEQSDRAVILHEFGHALGMIHEHQIPTGMIQWNRPVVIQAMWESNGWSAAETEQQIFARYTTAQTQFTALDPTSIMMYAFPPSFTLNGFSTPWNHQLSNKDQSFMTQQYPNTTPSRV